MPLDPARVKALFQSALDCPNPAERAAFLDRECVSDAELRGRLDELLAALDAPDTALDQPLVVAVDPESVETVCLTGEETAAVGSGSATAPETVVASDEPAEILPPETIIAGRYTLRQVIGEGGMGSVYLADQTHPVKRRVALKLIKPGMDSRTVLARFESERQALALMDHPHIAKVLDAGTTEQGRPFFVMELVKGVPLTDYCDQHRLDLPARLALFRQICSAVQHAHQKGIIHRDLKPTNILVESHDGKPVPKVIDFGLAKAFGGVQLTDQSLFTAFGSLAGTPLYMAPEQATFGAMDTDTRAGIYTLGVILYELLTGTTPIQRDTFKEAALTEMLRMIREVEPPIPSRRIGGSEGLASIAIVRRNEPDRLRRYVAGDLDWIVMKALAKDRARRYDSAIGLANDLERFLHHEPVLAGPPSVCYRVRKFARRYRPQVAAGLLVILAMIGGIIGTTWGLFEAWRQEGNAIKALHERETALLAEAAQRRQAEARLVQLDNQYEILGSIFTNLDPQSAEKGGKPLPELLGNNLDRATAAIEGEAIGDSLAVARMQRILGQSQMELGYPEKAIVLLEKARATTATRLGANHVDTLNALNNLASAYQAAGQLDRAVPLAEDAFARRKQILGPDNPNTLNSLTNLAEAYRAAGQLDRAVPLAEDAYTRRKQALGHDHIDTLNSLSNLAEVYRDLGRMDRAVPLHEEAQTGYKAKLGAAHPRTLNSLNNLASAYLAAGQFDRALPLFEQTLAAWRLKLGDEHPQTLSSMANLAVAFHEAGRMDRAVPLSEETLALRKKKLGPDHPDTLNSLGNLAEAYRDSGRADRAVPLQEEAFEARKTKLGPDHPMTLTSMTNLASAYQLVGRTDLALPLLEAALPLWKAKLGPDHPGTLTVMNNLAAMYRTTSQPALAVPLLEQVMMARRAKLGPDHLQTLTSMTNLSAIYLAVNQLDRAVPLAEQALAAWRARVGPEHPGTIHNLTNLATIYQAAAQPDRALPLYREYLAFRKRQQATDAPTYAAALSLLSGCLVEAKQWDEAETTCRECLAIYEAREPDAWVTFSTRSILGGALLGQGKLADAEPLLRSGYEGMNVRKAMIPAAGKVRLVAALDRLIAFGEQTGKGDEVKAWREEKAKLEAKAAPAKRP